MNKIATHPL